MTSAPFNLGEKKIDLVPSTFSGLKNSLTLVKEQDGVIDLRFSEDELEVLASTHGPQGGKVDQQNLHHNDKNLKSSLVSGIYAHVRLHHSHHCTLLLYHLFISDNFTMFQIPKVLEEYINYDMLKTTTE